MFNYDQNQKNLVDSKPYRGDNNLMTLILNKQDKNSNLESELDAFTKEFDVSRIKSNNSLFQQKLINAQNKIVSEKGYLK